MWSLKIIKQMNKNASEEIEQMEFDKLWRGSTKVLSVKIKEMKSDKLLRFMAYVNGQQEDWQMTVSLFYNILNK